MNLIEQSALQDLKEKIIASRTELLNEFKKYDMANTGKFNVTVILEILIITSRTLSDALYHVEWIFLDQSITLECDA